MTRHPRERAGDRLVSVPFSFTLASPSASARKNAARRTQLSKAAQREQASAYIKILRKKFLTLYSYVGQSAPVPVHGGRILEASECGAGTGACGFGLRGSEAREAGPAQERSRQRWRARSPEARPLRTTTELWQA